MTAGTLQKMETIFSNPIQYFLTLSETNIPMNSLLGKEITIEHIGFQCLSCLKEKEIYRQGHCKKCFYESPAVGEWILHPELSKAHLGIEDRDLAYEQSVQLQPHIVYLANSSEVKVGVTRKSQLPTRWIDQGAHRALSIAEVPNRYLAGIAEVSLKPYIADKTNWRKMLTNTLTSTDLQQVKTSLEKYLPAEVLPYLIHENTELALHYPVLTYPTKVTSLNLLKTPIFKGILEGIKGQYLIFKGGIVFNVRSNEGYKVQLSF